MRDAFWIRQARIEDAPYVASLAGEARLCVV